MKRKSAQISGLGTEKRNSHSKKLDTFSALEIARVINTEDGKVAKAVKKALPQIAKAIDAVAKAIGSGGRLIYVGAGTSGRIAALDASECPPTFNTYPATVQYVMAGGQAALGAAAEYNEDSRQQGEHDIAELRPSKNDVVIGIAASGRTPYTTAAVEYARKQGAVTGAIVCNRGSALGKAAQIEMVAETGPEVLSGSTRMKAGTAQKLICNMITTGAMSRLGYVYGNLMVNVHVSNEKLRERAIGILMEASGKQRAEAESALAESSDRVPVALVMLARGASAEAAQNHIKAAHGNIRRAIEAGTKRGKPAASKLTSRNR